MGGGFLAHTYAVRCIISLSGSPRPDACYIHFHLPPKMPVSFCDISVTGYVWCMVQRYTMTLGFVCLIRTCPDQQASCYWRSIQLVLTYVGSRFAASHAQMLEVYEQETLGTCPRVQSWCPPYQTSLYIELRTYAVFMMSDHNEQETMSCHITTPP